MKDCKATAMTVDLEEVEQIVEKLERGEEVEPMILCPVLCLSVPLSFTLFLCSFSPPTLFLFFVPFFPFSMVLRE